MRSSMILLTILGVVGTLTAGCGSADDSEVITIDTASVDGDDEIDSKEDDELVVAIDDEVEVVEEEPAEILRDAPQYEGQCPGFEEGLNSGFMSAGISRSFRVALPENPEGAPVIFAWHWLGGNASLLMSVLGLSRLADSEGVIVIAPESDGTSPFEWRFLDSPQNNADLQLFEDLLACASDQFDVDLDRIYSTGHSAGGLWTSYLTMHASDWLAATAIMSGGANAQTYTTPERQLPVLVIWGGEGDTYGSFRFADSSRFLAGELLSDGHFVTNCDHGQGHIPPPQAMDFIWPWFEDHPYTADRPYADGLPGVFPTYCTIQ